MIDLEMREKIQEYFGCRNQEKLILKNDTTADGVAPGARITLGAHQEQLDGPP
jgi:hypothetical protein